MGLGSPAITTNQRREPAAAPGPPFVPTSANNGLSVDGVTGKIVLGNDENDLAQAAALLSNREIVSALFQLFLKDIVTPGTKNQARLDAFGLNLTQLSNLGITPRLNVENTAAGDISTLLPQSLSITDFSGNLPSIGLLTSVAGLDYSIRNNGGIFEVVDTAFNKMLVLDQTLKTYSIGDVSFIGNGTVLFADDPNLTIDIETNGGNDFWRVQNVGTNYGFISGSLTYNGTGSSFPVFAIDGNLFTWKIGDIGPGKNGSVLTIDDAAQNINIVTGGNPYLRIHPPANDITFGDISNGNYFAAYATSDEMDILTSGTRAVAVSSSLQTYSLGDIDVSVNGSLITVNDSTQVLEVAAANGVNINGTPGFTGTVTPVTSITVQGGIVTAVS